uniref:Uncharacterized protein n=1 Tax=Rhizophora mucronata TaxID=61149 RepID=A0A2P2QJ59_RHIMU
MSLKISVYVLYLMMIKTSGLVHLPLALCLSLKKNCKKEM